MGARERESLAELRKLSFGAHVVNSVASTLGEVGRLTPEFIKAAPYDDLAMKFLKHMWNTDLKKESEDIMEDPKFDTEVHREDFKFILTKLPLQSEVRSEASISGIEEPACKENTQGPRQPPISKRSWDEGEVSPTAQSLQKKARTSTRAQAELPAAQNTGGSLQEHQTPNLGSPITSLRYVQPFEAFYAR
ncbi:hypothetical protein FLAG1_11910 [Fusarium langsethiae]|uniref:Uncharacterized protein n=1 Tax=Fusarium langsethiae TaxID=179993 RepID=A0A0N0DAI7_FUSLA|nr:hypothetical protein FLAG1_11910 [Fusarium langsethiae]